MPEDRRLAAIMFTDIVGYTRLMGSDEQKAVDMLSRNRSIHQSCIEKFNGTLIKEIGDGILASFSLASEAVRCAMEIQKECKQQSIPLKIGIHEGEMIFSRSDVIGDGVNIASRLQESAEDGCITISGSVYRDIKNKTGIKTEFLAEKTFKNVDEPIKIYSVLSEEFSDNTLSKKISKPSLPEKSTIIVLPFVDISPDQDNEYFSDGLTEEIIADLSHIQNLLVISRSSAMTFKGSNKKIKDIANEVNVRYVLEGSVRKAGNKLRITAQLIDGVNDAHLWAEKYIGTLEDIFDIQEQVSSSIANELEIRISSGEKKKIHERPIDNAFAYDCYLRASREIMSFSKERLEPALILLHKGIDIIGENAVIFAGIAYIYFSYINLGIEQEKNIKKAEEFVKKALNNDPESAEAHFVLGCIELIFHGNAQKGISHLKQAYSIKPGDTDTMAWLALGYDLSGRIDAAMTLTERSITLDPLNPTNYMMKGINYFFQGRFDLAQEPILDFYRFAPESPMSQIWKSLILLYNDHPNECYEFINKFVKEPGQNNIEVAMILLKYIIKGDQNKISSLLTPDNIKILRNDLQLSYHIATFYSCFNDKDQSLKWLENAIDRGFINYPLLNKYDKLLKNVRNDERFIRLMKRVKQEWENFEV